jgi:1-acyl-sn-glycerol-3-phosphate acyltransferase
MRLVLSYLLSPIYLLTFGLLLVIFHLVQVFCLYILGEQARKKSVDVLNFFLHKTLLLVNIDIKWTFKGDVPETGPILIVANHQSLFDIPPIIWNFRRRNVRFIAKKELQKGIPSVSYNLRKGGSALIDRKNREQALAEIERMARGVKVTHDAICIFPEGTRSKTGELKQFATGGIEAIIRIIPGVKIVPVAIKNSYRISSKGMFPIRFGTRAEWVVLPGIDPIGKSPLEITNTIRGLISSEINDRI